MRPTHVLIPIDFSEASDRVLQYGLSVAGAFEAEVTLVHVVVLPAEESAAAEARERLASIVPEPFKGKARLHTPLVDCAVEEELLRTVRETSADLVVLGTQGLRPIKRFLLGSTTEHLLRVLPVPLITVPRAGEDEERASSTAPSIERILYPTDFSDRTEPALATAVEFARRFEAELEIVHVVEHLVPPMGASRDTGREVAEEQQALSRRAEESIQRIVSGRDLGGISVKRTVLEGHPWQAILVHAGEAGTDLIVMSLHGLSFIERALLGATAERIIRAASVPVLGIPVQ